MGQAQQARGQPQPPSQGPGYGPQGPAGQPSTARRAVLEPIRVGDIARTDVVTAEPDTPIATVVAEMAERNVGSVVIVEEDTPVGIVTDRGVALALETTPDVAEREAEYLLTEDLLTGSADMSVLDALHRMADAGVRRLPIVDEEGGLQGIVTIDDVLVMLGQEFADVTRVVEGQSPGR